MYRPNLQSVALAVSEIIVIAVLGWGCDLSLPNLGEGEAIGGRDGTVRKSVVNFLKALHSNVSSILTRFRDIAAFVIQHATPPLISPKFPHVPVAPDRACWCQPEQRP